jgi:hypothetical protein
MKPYKAPLGTGRTAAPPRHPSAAPPTPADHGIGLTAESELADATRYHHAGMTRGEVARAVPAGSRRIGGQPEALRVGLSCPDLAEVRPQFRRHLEGWWRVHVRHASWGGQGRPPRGVSSPGRARVCQVTGMSVTTYKACRAWWSARGYVAIARPGRTPMLRAAVLADPDRDHNTSQAYVLCVPRRRETSPGHHQGQARARTRPLSQSPRDCDGPRAREQARKPGKPPEPGTSGALRPPLLYRGPLARITEGWWAHLTAPFAGWSASDLVWAIDHFPDGRQHRTRLANVRHPASWLRWRLSHWLTPDGAAIPSPTQRRAEAAAKHRSYLARQEHELGLARRSAELRAAHPYDHITPGELPAFPEHPGNSARSWSERRLAGWAADRQVCTRPQRSPVLPAWWTESVAAAAAAVTAEEADGPQSHTACGTRGLTCRN